MQPFKINIIDPHIAGILTVYAHLASSMKENFAQYMP